MSLSDVLRGNGVLDALQGEVCGLYPARSVHFHNVRKMSRKTPAMVIQEKGLAKGVKVQLPDGTQRKIRLVRDDEVFVEGIRDCINVYGVIVIT